MSPRSPLQTPTRLLLVGPGTAWTPAVREAAARIGAAVDIQPSTESALAWMLPPCRIYSHVLATVPLTARAIDSLAGMLDEVTLTPTPLLLLGGSPSAVAGVRCIPRPDAEMLLQALRTHWQPPVALPPLAAPELAASLHGGCLRMRFQPILRSHDLAPLGLEALARVHHTTRGILHPRNFIPLAVASGLERVLTGIAASRTFLDLRSGLLSSGIYATLNIPMVTLLHHPAAVRGQELCQLAGTSPDRIVIEVLENSTAPDTAVLGRAIEAWRKAGFRLAIDDAGPNLPHWRSLVDLPFDMLKLDGAMVADPACHDQVEAIVEAALRRGLFVVAEGIEDEACLSRMRALGVGGVQGFLFSRPLPSLAVPVWLRQWESARLSSALTASEWRLPSARPGRQRDVVQASA